MSDFAQKNVLARRMYRFADSVAEPVKIALQFTIGAVLAMMVVVKGLNYLGFPVPCPPGNPLDIAGQALMVSAGIELAYMLFTEGPDEAVQPLILGLASAALVTASSPIIGYEKAVVIGILCCAIAALFFVKHMHLKDR